MKKPFLMFAVAGLLALGAPVVAPDQLQSVAFAQKQQPKPQPKSGRTRQECWDKLAREKGAPEGKGRGRERAVQRCMDGR